MIAAMLAILSLSGTPQTDVCRNPMPLPPGTVLIVDFADCADYRLCGAPIYLAPTGRRYWQKITQWEGTARGLSWDEERQEWGRLQVVIGHEPEGVMLGYIEYKYNIESEKTNNTMRLEGITP